VGSSYEYVREIHKLLGERAVYQVDPATGQKKFMWTYVESRPTGKTEAVKDESSDSVLILSSTDYRIFAFVTVDYNRSNSLGPVRDWTNHTVLICDADLFWKYLLAAINGDDLVTGDYFESKLREKLTVEQKAAMRLDRLAGLWASACDESDWTSRQVADHAAAADQALPGVTRRLLDALADEIWLTKNPALERRADVIGRLGAPAHVSTLLPLLNGIPKSQKPAQAAIRRLAQRHSLPNCPPDEAPLAAWRTWAKQAAPQ
jgi:hypothetical protein